MAQSSTWKGVGECLGVSVLGRSDGVSFGAQSRALLVGSPNAEVFLQAKMDVDHAERLCLDSEHEAPPSAR